MALFHIVVLAIVQGITEFLPISSSGHLILVPWVTGWADQGLRIDVAVHVGTLGAVLAYLWRDVWLMTRSLPRLHRGLADPGARLIIHLVVATIPVVIAGYLVKTYAGNSLRDPALIGWTTLIFGIVLFAADKVGLTIRRIEHMTTGGAFSIGLAQVLALIPGVSRSGITMTAARVMGYERREAARFSMLMSIPTIIAAGTLTGLDLAEAGDRALQLDAVLAAGLSFVAALIAIALMMRWLARASFTPFVIYRLLLGGVILYWVA